MALLMGPKPQTHIFNEIRTRYKMKTYEIIDAIIFNKEKEKYEEWKNHEHESIRETLAKYGYFPEHFINDESPRVRISILYKHEEYLLQFLKEPRMACAAINFLIDKENATVEELKLGLKIARENNMDKREPHILTKLKSAQMQPTPLESTMSLPQLFKSGSLAWARPFSISQIALLSNVPQETTEDELENILNPKMGTREIRLAIRKIHNRLENKK